MWYNIKVIYANKDYMVNSLVQKGKQFLNIIKPKTRLGLMSGIFVAGLCLFFLFVVGDIARGEDGSIGDSILMAIGDLFLWIASKFMGLTIFILKFVIEIASYNGYINSNAVGLGWILVRDITNMFFVIILMLIAFVTVLGIEQYEWKKLLVKFVLAAILVNFSRVICGVIIDAAQVFMMTFISGVAATAGGNIFNALQLNDIVSFSKNVSPTEMSSGNMVASAMMAMIFAFGTMLVMGGYLIVLLSRVIALWILIILSPLAFILGIIPKFQTYSSQWWSEFSNNVIIGPVLAFFLWLAFAVAGGGMAHSEFAESSYPMGDNYKAEMETVSREGEEEGGSNLNKFLESEQLASFLIAFFMLMAGVKVATKLGAAGSEIMGQAGAFAMKGAAMMSGVAAVKWGARTAGRAAVSGAKKAGKFAAMKAPIVGGEAWQERGLRMKKKAGEAVGFWNEKVMGGYKAGGIRQRLQVGGRKGRMDELKKQIELRQQITGASTVGAPPKMKDETAYLEAKIKALGKGKEYVKTKRSNEAIEKLIKQEPGMFKGEEGLYFREAQTARLKIEGERAEQGRVAEARNTEYEHRRGVATTRYTQDLAARHKKEDMEFWNTQNADLFLSEMERIKTARDQSEVGSTKREALTEDLTDMMQAAMSRSASLGVKAMAIVSPTQGVREAGDVVAQQADFLSAHLDRQVDASTDAVRTAFDELKTKMGGQFEGAMTVLANSFENMADNGAISFAGLMRTNRDGSWKLVDPTNDDDNRFRENKVIQARSQASAGRARGLRGMVDRDHADGKVRLSCDSEAARDNLVSRYRGITPPRAANVAFQDVADLNEIFSEVLTASDERKGQIKQNLQLVVNGMIKANPDNDKGVKALFARLDEKIKDALGDGIKVPVKGKEPVPLFSRIDEYQGGEEYEPIISPNY